MSGSTRADAAQPSAGDPSSLPRRSESQPAESLRVLLTQLIDYAGLFPPAELSMRDAVRNYAEHRGSSNAWMLGRFIVPVARLDELADAMTNVSSTVTPWHLSALIGSDSAKDVQAIRRFNTANAGRAVVAAVEVRVASADAANAAIEPFASSFTVFAEMPLGDDVEQMVDAVATAGGYAKVRTGGVTPETIPSSSRLARFLRACATHELPFKATAGLHHPLRDEYALTYEAGAPRATMLGFLNVFVAAVLARRGASAADVEALLDERDLRAMRFTDDGISWRNHELSVTELANARAEFALSFGSCSFDEPIQDLRALSLL